MQSCEEGSSIAHGKTIPFSSCIYPIGLGLNGKGRHVMSKLFIETLICGGETLEQVALRNCGCPVIRSGTCHMPSVGV